MIGRYGGCFEEDIRRLMCNRAYHITGFGCTGERCAVLERLAMVEGRKVRMIHGLNLSHKELTYLLQKSIIHRNKVLRACS